MPEIVSIGVGIDSARYGHCAAFLREDRQPAAKPMIFLESAEGYGQFAAALRQLAEHHGGNVHFHIRLDAAGQYAVNLEAFLRGLEVPKTVSIGEPKRNKDYKNAHYPKRKADAVDSLACARFAILERPPATPATPIEFAQLRDLASALAGQRKQTTRSVNRLHNHLARVFPELAVLAPNLAADWVLILLTRYPTPERIAAARRDSIATISHVGAERAEALQAAARRSTGSLRGPLAEALVRQLVDAIRQSQKAERQLFELLEAAYDALPEGAHRQLETIPGIGKRTAAALVAKIVSIDRFPTPATLVSYFGAFPEENTSGVDRRGHPLPKGTMRMSPKGNDLVRGLLWMACLSAVRRNPAVRALHLRQRAAGKPGGVSLGHCMRKLLHLVYAVWKTNQPFDPRHYPWEVGVVETPASTEPLMENGPAPAETTAKNGLRPTAAEPPAHKDAAGRRGQSPERKAVTAAAMQLATRTIPSTRPPAKRPANAPGTRRPIDFARLRQQVRMTDVLGQLGWLDRLGGAGAQRRGPCPIHEPNAPRGRCFSVNLDKHVFRCLHPECAAAGNVLDLWAAVHRVPLRDAALHLAQCLGLDNQPEIQSPTVNQETHS